MYFSEGSDRAFEQLMTQKPASTIMTAALTEQTRTAATAATLDPTGKSAFVSMKYAHLMKASPLRKEELPSPDSAALNKSIKEEI